MATKDTPTAGPKKAPEVLTVNVNGEDREVFMSFGLLNELTTLVSDPARVTAIPLDPELRSKVLTALLAKRKKSGKIEEAIDIDDVEISIDHVEQLLEWSASHIMGFFIRSLQKVVALTQAQEATAAALVSSLDGSKASASAKQSSGASA